MHARYLPDVLHPGRADDQRVIHYQIVGLSLPWCAIMPGVPLTPDELLTTTRSVRKRLDLTRPVPLELVKECLEIALQAPNGGMRQGWH